MPFILTVTWTTGSSVVQGPFATEDLARTRGEWLRKKTVADCTFKVSPLQLEPNTTREAFVQILGAARTASQTHWASGHLALIEQICLDQLGLEPTTSLATLRDDRDMLHG